MPGNFVCYVSVSKQFYVINLLNMEFRFDFETRNCLTKSKPNPQRISLISYYLNKYYVCTLYHYF